MKTGEERRKYPRSTSRFRLRYRLLPIGEADYLEGQVEDVSPYGLRFQTDRELNVRAGMLLELQLPGADPLHAFGRTAWIRALPNGAGYEVGSGFVDQSTAMRHAIERHLQEQNGRAASRERR